MPYADAFVRMQMLFELLPGEVASAGLSIGYDGGAVVISDAEADDFAVAALNFWGAIKYGYAVNTRMVGTRFQLVGTDGHVHQTVERVVTAIPGTSGQYPLPSETAVCLSLVTASAGRSGRGRCYLPGPARDQINEDGRVLAAFQSDVADAAQAMGNDINDATHFLAVASQTTAGIQPVTRVRVGDVFDVQRRRRDALIEDYEVRDLS